ncbi:SAM-dependent methyltransferase [Oceaniglobus ichthyenteri]|uniref:SAM-dependent methyltransferase n=1 Tax=Oceaniglobus ichthyenteri TaxID=2136177 RepID=UPI000D380E3F|nr:class I SAM-dependent methyltransferase [Oceaniglobus ichthyenteri]
MSWNKRYEREEYLFGTAPADYLVRYAPVLPSRARVLCVADGEGRNSVYLASLGHEVTAFDPAPAAVEKARKLAARKGVHVAFNIAGIEDWDWTAQFDAVVGIFIQFVGPKWRARLFTQLAGAVKPGGLLLLHGYAPRQVEYGTGGPGDARNMYDDALLRAAFEGWQIDTLRDYDAMVDEGEGHYGKSALVDFVARKP